VRIALPPRGAYRRQGIRGQGQFTEDEALTGNAYALARQRLPWPSTPNFGVRSKTLFTFRSASSTPRGVAERHSGPSNIRAGHGGVVGGAPVAMAAISVRARTSSAVPR